MIDDDVGALGPALPDERVEHLRQLAEPELGGSTTAARVLGEADRGLGFGRHADDDALRRVPVQPIALHVDARFRATRQRARDRSAIAIRAA